MGIATDSLRTYLFRIANLTVGFLSGVLTARFLGPEGKGTFTLALLIGTLYANIFGNLGGAITYQLTRLHARPQPVFLTASVYGWVIGLATIGGFWLYTLLVPEFEPGFLWLVVLNAPLLLTLTNLNGFFMGLNRISILNWLSFGSGLILLLCLSIGLLGFGIGVKLALAGWVLAQLLMVGWGYWISRGYFLTAWGDIFQPQLLREMLKFGWQLGLINLITFLNYRVDMFLVAHFLGKGQLGFYSIAVSLAELLWFTSTAIGTAIYARMGMAELQQAGLLTAKAVRHTLFINLLCGVALWVGAEVFLTLIYGEVYRPALVPLRILLPGVLAYGLAGIFSAFFTNQLGRPRVALCISLMAMLLNVLVCLLLIPQLGIAGGAWATTISYLVAIGVLIGIFLKQTKLTWREVFWLNRDDWADYRKLAGNAGAYLSRRLR